MKISFSILFVLVILTFQSCTKKTVPTGQSFQYFRNAKVSHLSSTKLEVNVSSEQSAENIEKAIYFAEINALENLLYRGVPGSIQENPIIPDEVAANKKSGLILKGLINDRGYQTFMTQSAIIDKFKSDGAVTVIQSVSFDVNALRKFLEKNEVIRKFGY